LSELAGAEHRPFAFLSRSLKKPKKCGRFWRKFGESFGISTNKVFKEFRRFLNIFRLKSVGTNKQIGFPPLEKLIVSEIHSYPTLSFF